MGESGGAFDDAFVTYKVAQTLNIPHYEVQNTPLHVINSAWTCWLAERNAAMRLRSPL